MKLVYKSGILSNTVLSCNRHSVQMHLGISTIALSKWHWIFWIFLSLLHQPHLRQMLGKVKGNYVDICSTL